MNVFEQKLTRIIKSNSYRNENALMLMESINNCLTDKTKNRIVSGNLLLEIYYDIFLESMDIAQGNSSTFDMAVNAKLSDQNYISNKIAIYQH